jgi:hypothetical protein
MSERNMSASEVVSDLRAEVEATTGLTISAGIAPNTMLAKVSISFSFKSIFYCTRTPLMSADSRSALIRTSRTDNSNSLSKELQFGIS